MKNLQYRLFLKQQKNIPVLRINKIKQIASIKYQKITCKTSSIEQIDISANLLAEYCSAQDTGVAPKIAPSYTLKGVNKIYFIIFAPKEV